MERLESYKDERGYLFKVGDSIVCEDDNGSGISPLSKGWIYTISEILDIPIAKSKALYEERIRFRLEELGQDTTGWKVERFIPYNSRETAKVKMRQFLYKL